jgi:NitT/TauT family transport system permease protein
MKQKNKKSRPEYSDQELFVRNHKKQHHQIAFMRILICVSFLLLWEISAQLNWIDPFFFASPTNVVICFWDLLLNGDLLTHTFITLLETIVSFTLVFLFSLLTSTLLWYSQRLSDIIEPYLVILNSLPKSALAPLFIVWLGTGIKTIIVAGISVAIFGSIISFYTGFKQVDPEKITLIYTLGGNKKDAFSKVVLPGSVPILISTTKVNIGLALVGVIIGEFLAARTGLGYLIIYGSQVFKLNMVITAIIILCFIAIAFYKTIQSVEHNIKKNYYK